MFCFFIPFPSLCSLGVSVSLYFSRILRRDERILCDEADVGSRFFFPGLTTVFLVWLFFFLEGRFLYFFFLFYIRVFVYCKQTESRRLTLEKSNLEKKFFFRYSDRFFLERYPRKKISSFSFSFFYLRSGSGYIVRASRMKNKTDFTREKKVLITPCTYHFVLSEKVPFPFIENDQNKNLASIYSLYSGDAINSEQ